MKTFLILIGPEGPEGLEEIPENFKERMFEEKITGLTTTSEEMKRLSSVKFAMDIRARLNSHRELGVYMIDVTYDFTKDEFYDLCSQSPKEMHELIVNKGKSL